MKINTAVDIKEIAAPTKGNQRHPVAGCPGLNLKITANDAWAWTYRYRPRLGPKAGASREYTIGAYPAFGVGVARDRWKELYRRVKDGEDPLEEIQQAQAAPNMRDLAERFLADVSSRKKSGARDVEKFRYINARLGGMKVDGVTFQDCDGLHQSMRLKPVAANRTLTILKEAFDLAIRLDWRKDKYNPAKLVKRYPEQARERYLSDEEYPRLFAELAESRNQVVADLIRFMLLTGCRKGEAFNMKWAHVDLGAKVWTKPTTKTGEPHRAPLSAPAMEVIACQPRNGDYVFATSTGRPFTDIKKQWQTIRTAAGIEDVRLHDLRHSAASVLASDGESLKIIGELLRHKDAKSTNRYAHVNQRAARAAADKLGRKLTSGGKHTANVRGLRG